MNNIIKHFCLITKHKYYVFKECCKVGLFWRGLIHDLSKYSPTEFFESVKYYTGTKSPIDVCKEQNGYSMAWLHHKGRNPHHYEYWQDNFDKGTDHLMMPYKYAAEMVCDYIGAARAYMKDDFTYEKEFNWYVNTKRDTAKGMNPYIREFMYLCLYFIGKENIPLSKSLIETIYIYMGNCTVYDRCGWEEIGSFVRTPLIIDIQGRKYEIDFDKTRKDLYIENISLIFPY